MSAADSPNSSESTTSSQHSSSHSFQRTTRYPPKAEVDDSPLQKSMDRNKESLKVKLMLRRPINQLVAQGIMPQLKTSPSIHEQRQKLERAKMGDLLKAKIQQRPEKQELVRQNILEDVGHVDPSLAERQRMLKKCRLVDALNDQLSHRPGPLELIKKNILHTEEPIERAVKEGHIEFKATCEGQKVKPEPPDHYTTVDDDSQSSDAHSPREGSISAAEYSPPTCESYNLASAKEVFRFRNSCADMIEKAAANAGIVAVSAPQATILTAVLSPISLSSPVSSPSCPSMSTASATCSSASYRVRSSLPFHQHNVREKNRKKIKTKTHHQKTRTIKFHEYKGPSSAQRHSSSVASLSNSETSYDLLLQQQQLFLQWQLEWQHKYPQLLLPSPPKGTEVKPPSPATSLVLAASTPTPILPHPPAQLTPPSPQKESSSETPPTPPPLPPPVPPPLPVVDTNTKTIKSLEDMKVSDLKAELKKRNLPVSGPKPQLIQRLKPFTDNILNSNRAVQVPNRVVVRIQSYAIQNGDDSITDSNVSSPRTVSQPVITSDRRESALEIPHFDLLSSSGELPFSGAPDGNIIREQQRKIEELERQLINSQLLLQQQQESFQPPSTLIGKDSLAFLQHQNQITRAMSNNDQQILPDQSCASYSAQSTKTKSAQRGNPNNKMENANHVTGANLYYSPMDTGLNVAQKRTTTLPNFFGTFVSPQLGSSQNGMVNGASHLRNQLGNDVDCLMSDEMEHEPSAMLNVTTYAQPQRQYYHQGDSAKAMYGQTYLNNNHLVNNYNVSNNDNNNHYAVPSNEVSDEEEIARIFQVKEDNRTPTEMIDDALHLLKEMGEMNEGGTQQQETNHSSGTEMQADLNTHRQQQQQNVFGANVSQSMAISALLQRYNEQHIWPANLNAAIGGGGGDAFTFGNGGGPSVVGAAYSVAMPWLAQSMDCDITGYNVSNDLPMDLGDEVLKKSDLMKVDTLDWLWAWHNIINAENGLAIANLREILDSTDLQGESNANTFDLCTFEEPDFDMGCGQSRSEDEFDR